jgi:drug/metabolite transporter (DMT)-like permease
MVQNNQRKAMFMGLGAVLSWSTVATAFKLTLKHVDHFQLLFLATVFSIFALGLVLVVQGKVDRLFKATARQYAQCFGLGFLNPFLYYLVLFKAYSLLPAQVAQPLNYTWALTLSWLAVPFLGHKLGRVDFLAGIICYFGVLVISTGGDVTGLQVDSWLGVGLALGSTLIWATYWIMNKRSSLDPVVGLFLGFVFALPLVTLVTAMQSDFVFDKGGLIGGAYVGMIEMGFTFVLWLMAMKLTTNTARVANLIFLSPFLSLVFIQFVLGEDVRLGTVGGLVLIVGGLYWQGRSAVGDEG